MPAQILLVRHGETEWSKSGQHTGRSDIPLTDKGEHDARNLAARLGDYTFSHVLTSPRLRARRTCELVGLQAQAVIEPDLAEWDYGDYEGLRTLDILKQRPGWSVFQHGCPHGESPEQVSDRADRVTRRIRELNGMAAVFSHGHFGRVLAARWINLPVSRGQQFLLSTSSLSILGYERSDSKTPAIVLWNSSALDCSVGA